MPSEYFFALSLGAAREADLVEHPVESRVFASDAQRRRLNLEIRPSAGVGVERRFFDSALRSGAGRRESLVAGAGPEQRGAAALGARDAQQQAHRRRLAGAVGAEQSGDAAGLNLEAQRIDHGARSVALRDVVELDEGGHCRAKTILLGMLTQRQEQILRIVVDAYTRTGTPVGSRAIADRPEVPWAASTVRNEFAVLVSHGLLEQPHTSAGRRPTEGGYRYFVDELLARRDARAHAAGDRTDLRPPRDRRRDPPDHRDARRGQRADGACLRAAALDRRDSARRADRPAAAQGRWSS